LNNLIW